MESVYQRHKETIVKIQAMLQKEGIEYSYRDYRKTVASYWRCVCESEQMERVARKVLHLPKVKEVKIIHRIRKCTSPKEYFYGDEILRLSVAFIDY